MHEDAKILLIDIETAPNKVYSWGLFKQNIAINQIVESGYTLCWAAKWLGKKKMHFERGYGDDNDAMIEGAWQLLDEADIVIHYNGTKFDIPTLNREFLLKRYAPPSPFQEIDLLRTVRARFRFPSNKLDYVAQQLGLGGKVTHKGMEMWKACMAGNDTEWRHMERYNKQDVVLLEELYAELLPWIKPHPNMGLFGKDWNMVCNNCGSANLKSNGFRRTTTQVYRRLHCTDCGTWNRERKTALLPSQSRNILTGDK